MTLTLDLDRTVTTHACPDCGGTREVVTGFVYRDDEPHAVYFASCYPAHREVWIDVILGTWDDDSESQVSEGKDAEADNDHVTFGCRFGQVEGQAIPACSLVTGAAMAPETSTIYGQRLDRDQALAHPWLTSFWEIVDVVLVQDPTVHPYWHNWSSA